MQEQSAYNSKNQTLSDYRELARLKVSCDAHTCISEKILVTGLRIRKFRVRIRGIDCGEEGVELVLDRMDSNHIKLALRELSHEIMKALKVVRSDV